VPEGQPQASQLHLPGRRRLGLDLVCHRPAHDRVRRGQSGVGAGRAQADPVVPANQVLTAGPLDDAGMTTRRRIARASLAAFAAASVVILAGCGSGDGIDSGGLSAGDRSAAQTALDGLSGTNISRQLVAITGLVQSAPTACRVHQVSSDPHTFEVYV